LSLQRLFQLISEWQFDIGSLVFGLILGFLLTNGFRRAWPTLYRWQQKISSRIRQWLARIRSGVQVRYQAETAEYLQYHHLGGAWARLEQVFVQPRILIPPKEYDPTRPFDWGAGQLIYLWPRLVAGMATPESPSISLKELLLNGRRTILSAIPGSGKTTLLAYGAYQCATATADGPDSELFSVIPVFIHLAELDLGPVVDIDPESKKLSADPVSPLTAALQKRSSPITSTGIKGMLAQKLRSGKLLLLLDGLDEMSPTGHARVIHWLSMLLASYPAIQVVVAASLNGYGPLLELDFILTGLLPWRAGQVEQFANQWRKAFPISKTPHLNHYWRAGQSALKTCVRFWSHAVLHEINGKEVDLPVRRLDLMVKSLPLFMSNVKKHQNSENGLDMPLPDRTTLAFWQRLAYTLVTEEKLGVTQVEVAEQIAETLVEQQTNEKGEVARLHGSISQSSLFISWSNGLVGFISPVWRDFLAASFMTQQGLQREALSHLGDPYWTDVLLFYVGRMGATELATKMLAQKDQSLTRDALFQVASWMAEAPDSGEWRRKTMILLGQIIRQTTFAYVLRQRATAALAQTAESGVLTFLSQLLERSDPFLRQVGASALTHVGSGKAIDLLAKMLKDNDGLVRQTAVQALTMIEHPNTEHPLLMALIQGDDEMRRIVAQGLAWSGSKGIEILKEAIEDNDAQVRRAAVQGLALVDEKWVVPILVGVERNDKAWIVQSAATEALARIRTRENSPSWQPLPASQQRWLVQFAAQEGRIVPDGAATLPFLVQILSESPQPKLRVAAAESLGRLCAKDVLPALETAVRDTEKQVSEAAFTALCQLQRGYGDTVFAPQNPQPNISPVEEMVTDNAQRRVHVE